MRQDAMTSAHSMQASRSRAARVTLRVVGLLGLVLVASCAPNHTRQDLAAPYPETRLWAVAPPINESGVSIVNPPQVADLISRELQQVRGVDVLPVNRVLAAMRDAGVEQITAAAVPAIMDRLGVDGLVVGSVSVYDPYPPLTLGLALELYTRAPKRGTNLDPVEITRTTRGPVPPASTRGIAPTAQATGVFDARDQVTLGALAQYADSRHVPDSAFGPDEYLVSMELYAQFVSHRLIRELLVDEQFRLDPMVVNQDTR